MALGIRVARVSTLTRRTLKVLCDDFERVHEAEEYLAGYGRHTGCTQHSWGDWRTRNVIQYRDEQSGAWR